MVALQRIRREENQSARHIGSSKLFHNFRTRFRTIRTTTPTAAVRTLPLLSFWLGLNRFSYSSNSSATALRAGRAQGWCFRIWNSLSGSMMMVPWLPVPCRVFRRTLRHLLVQPNVRHHPRGFLFSRTAFAGSYSAR